MTRQGPELDPVCSRLDQCNPPVWYLKFSFQHSFTLSLLERPYSKIPSGLVLPWLWQDLPESELFVCTMSLLFGSYKLSLYYNIIKRETYENPPVSLLNVYCKCLVQTLGHRPELVRPRPTRFLYRKLTRAPVQAKSTCFLTVYAVLA